MATKTSKTLTIQTIGDIDRGRVALAFNHALRMATLDVLDRPADKGKRKIQLTVELVPDLDKDTGVLDCINSEFVVKTAVPVRRSAAYPMLPTDDGTQLFEPAAPFDPRQSAFAFTSDGEKIDTQTGEVASPDRDEESPM